MIIGVHMSQPYLIFYVFFVVVCQTTCDEVLESSPAANRVSVVSVRYMASVGNAGAETVEIIWAVH